MSLHSWHHQGPHKPNSCATFPVNSHWGRAATGKKSHVYAHRVTLGVPNSLQPCRLWPAGFSVRDGVSPGKNTGAYWPILAAIPF